MKIPKYSCGSDDITFCMDECDNVKCFRHASNIIDNRYPVSMANLRGTTLCKLSKRDDETAYIKKLKDELEKMGFSVTKKGNENEN